MRLSKQREEDLTAPLESPLSPELLECTLNGNLEELKVNEEGTLRYNLPPALDLVNFSNIFTWDEERFEAFITEAEVEDTSSPSTSSLHCFTHEELPSNVMAEENKLSDYIQGGNDNSMATILVDAGVSLHSRGAIADLTISHKEEVHELLIENSADYHENCGRLYKENRRKAKVRAN